MLDKVRNRATSIASMLTGFADPLQTARVFLGRNDAGTIEVRTRDGAYDFAVRGPMDVWCLKETLLDEVYRVHGFAIEPGWTVIDIGAGFGDFSIVAARAATDSGRVLAFEPFPSSYELLARNIERNAASNVTPFQTAVTGIEREVRLDFTNFEPLQVKSDSTAAGDSGLTPSRTLAAVLDNEGIERVDLLKLDCEGCEYEVLMESPGAVLARVDRIVMEYHEPINGKTHETLVGFLRAHGFAVGSEPNVIHPDEIGYLRASRLASDLA